MSLIRVRDIAAAQLLGAINDPETVTGPGSATDEAHPRFNGTDGKTLQDSQMLENDNGEVGLGIAPQTNQKMTIQGDTSDPTAITLKLVNSNGNIIAVFRNNLTTTIGTGLTALAKLHVQDDSAGTERGLLALRNFSGDVDTAVAMRFFMADSVPHGEIVVLTVDQVSGGNGAIIFRTRRNGTSTEAMRIDSTGNIGIGPTPATPATSARLDLQGTTGALLLTRLTTAQRDALTPSNGMLIYNTTLNKFQGYENGAWTSLI